MTVWNSSVYYFKLNLILFRGGVGSNPSKCLLPNLSEVEWAASMYGRTARANRLDGLVAKAHSRSISSCQSTMKFGLKHEPE